MGTWTMIQVFPLPDDAPHTILILMLFLAFLFLSHKYHDSSYKSGIREGTDRGRKLGRTLPRKGMIFWCSVWKSSGSQACLWVCSGMQSTACSRPSLLTSPSSKHPGCQQFPVSQGCRFKFQETSRSPPEHRSPSVQCRVWLWPQEPNSFN